jgi:hypothetical protein
LQLNITEDDCDEGHAAVLQRGVKLLGKSAQKHGDAISLVEVIFMFIPAYSDKVIYDKSNL